MENFENILPRQDRRLSREVRVLSLIGGAAAVGLAFRRGRFLGPVLSAIGADLITLGLSGHYLHEFLGLKSTDRDIPNRRIPYQLGVQIRHAVTIDRQVDDVYDYFRNFENLPKFMDHLQSVKVFDDKRSHWTARGPLGMSVEWDAEIISDVPDRLISWRSTNTPDIETAGSVRFVPLSHGRTLLQISMQYLPPAGAVGTAAAKLFGEEPDQQIQDDLRNFKQLMESGTMASQHQGVDSASDDKPSGSGASSSDSPERFSAKRRAAGSNEPT